MDGLKFWVDNGDAILQTGELKNLGDFGIKNISIDFTDNSDSNIVPEPFSYASTEGGEDILVEDVWFLNVEHLPQFDRSFLAWIGFHPPKA